MADYERDEPTGWWIAWWPNGAKRLDGKFRRFESVCGIDDEVLGPEYGRSGGTGSSITLMR